MKNLIAGVFLGTGRETSPVVLTTPAPRKTPTGPPWTLEDLVEDGYEIHYDEDEELFVLYCNGSSLRLSDGHGTAASLDLLRNWFTEPPTLGVMEALYARTED